MSKGRMTIHTQTVTGAHPRGDGPTLGEDTAWLCCEHCRRDLGFVNVRSDSATWTIQAVPSMRTWRRAERLLDRVEELGSDVVVNPKPPEYFQKHGPRAQDWAVEDFGGHPYLVWQCGCGRRVKRNARKLVDLIARDAAFPLLV